MRFLGVPLALLFAVVVVANVSAGEDEKEKKGKKAHLIRGRVEEVHKDKDMDSGYIEIERREKKGVAKREKFKVTPDTKVEKVHREGKEVDRTPATFGAVHKGEHVLILPMEGAPEVAKRIEIVVHKKGKKGLE
jgi:hypothetical protein